MQDAKARVHASTVALDNMYASERRVVGDIPGWSHATSAVLHRKLQLSNVMLARLKEKGLAKERRGKGRKGQAEAYLCKTGTLPSQGGSWSLSGSRAL